MVDGGGGLDIKFEILKQKNCKRIIQKNYPHNAYEFCSKNIFLMFILGYVRLWEEVKGSPQEFLKLKKGGSQEIGLGASTSYTKMKEDALTIELAQFVIM